MRDWDRSAYIPDFSLPTLFLSLGGQPLVADASSTAFAHCREQLLGKHMRDRITFGSFVLSER